ncbi:hypothetical protein [Nitratifractor sp.]
MSPSGGTRYTPKQIEKYRRQSYIAHLGKIGKNLFRMLRAGDGVTLEQFRKRFDELIRRLDELDPIRLDSEHLRQSEEYYRSLHQRVHAPGFAESDYRSMREEEMSNLNRLQKMKNRSSYRKEKHRDRPVKDGWE